MFKSLARYKVAFYILYSIFFILYSLFFILIRNHVTFLGKSINSKLGFVSNFEFIILSLIP
ncbi:hypothetical protein B0M43_0019245 [Flavobacterium sp. KBS0721]|nr:hypothetical protein B0M43_0019245 [Flavobacterium sp. KBS0721]